MDARSPSEDDYELARQYWLACDALESADRGERLRVDRGDLRQPFSDAYDAIGDASRREDLLVALIDTRRNNDTDLVRLGAGFVESVWADDDEILLKLRHRGLPAAVLVAIESHIGK